MDGEKQRATTADDLGLDFASLFGNVPEQEAGLNAASRTEAQTGRDTTREEVPPQGSSEALRGQQAKGLFIERQQQKAQELRMMEVCREYQANIKASDELQAQILKGLKAGADPIELLLQAAKAISLMTGNALFHNQVAADIRDIYGRGLGYAAPLREELEVTRHRLGRLLEAQRKETAHSDGWDIRAAIAAHERKIQELEARLKEAQ